MENQIPRFLGVRKEDGGCIVTICNISEVNGMLSVLQMLWEAISVFANQDCEWVIYIAFPDPSLVR